MADAEVAPISFKKRTNKSTNIRKRPATPPPEDRDPSSSDDSSGDEDGDSGTRIKRRRKEGLTTTTTTTNSSLTRPADLSKSTQYTASRSTTLSANDDATKTQHWSVSDAAAKASTQQASTTDIAESDGAYKGTSTYGSFISKNPNAPTRAVGPVKAAASNVRTITVTDFAPDVCKDYKQTGFCGFGDNCKFLHAREDYKQGWQLDKEWESAGKKSKSGKDGKAGEEVQTEEEKMLEGIPFVCIICKGDYKKPVVTKCGHYFCEACAMGRYLKEKKKTCANCGADTGGSFGVAKRLEGLLSRKRRRIEEKEKETAEGGDGE